MEVRKCLPIPLRGVGAIRYVSDEWFYMDAYLDGQDKDANSAVAYIRHEVDLVDNLGAKFLMGMDIMGPEQVVINIPSRKLRSQERARPRKRDKHLYSRTMVPPRPTGKIAPRIKNKPNTIQSSRFGCCSI
jgi:hypothetical protein